MGRDLLRSLWLSMKRNGFFQTLKLVLHYLRFKTSTESYYTFRFQPLKQSVSLRPGTSDFSVFRQIMMNGEYDMPLPNSYVIIDAGANIGLASLHFCSRFPGSTIYAIEPDSGNYQALAYQVRDLAGVKIFHRALWSRKEMLQLQVTGADAWGIQVQSAQGGNVQGIDLTSFMQEQKINQIDVLKVDIEGAEVELFQGNYDYWLRRTRILIIELHETLRPGCEKMFYEAINTISHRLERSGENIVVYNLEA